MLANAIYLLALMLASPWILYRRLRHGRYRQGISQKLFGLSSAGARRLTGGRKNTLWIHAVSVGEVELLPGLVKQLDTDPETAVVISVSTDSGHALATDRFGADRVFFCPLDFTWAVSRTLRHLGVRKLALAELELWPNLIRLAGKRGADVVVFNGRLSQRSCEGYQRFGWLTRAIFRGLQTIGCQTQADADRFIACGASPEHVLVTGSLKFDNAPRTRDSVEVQQRLNWAGIDAWNRVWCFGSTQAGEEAMALSIYGRLSAKHPELRLLLAPRHQERFDEVADLISRRGYQAVRRSRDESQYADELAIDEVLLIDTIGELRHWWGVCQIATVGGSFGNRGGQNMLDPAGYGAAVSFGPNTTNFKVIADELISAEAAIRVASEDELEAFVERCLTDIPAADGLGKAAQQVIDRHRGATERTVLMIQGRERHGTSSGNVQRRVA
ncbi:MAG: 3-deoxy-D-manno-octulosonic acid transferase [Planctomycetota bacterium]